SFIVLYIVHGLGRSPAVASGVIAVVAVAYVVGAPLAGRLADRYGLVRVLRLTSLLYGIRVVYRAFPATLAPPPVRLPVIALAGAVVLTLPQALAFTLAPPGSEGVAAGLQDFSRGIGLVLGPVVVGAMVTATRGVFSSTDGYASMWLVIGVPVLLAALLLRRLETSSARCSALHLPHADELAAFARERLAPPTAPPLARMHPRDACHEVELGRPHVAERDRPRRDRSVVDVVVVGDEALV